MHRTGAAFLALIALLVAGATTAATASAKKLVLSEDGVALAPGASFEIYGANALSVTTPPDGEVECEEFHETGIEVSVSTNSASKDQLQLTRLFGADFGPCRSFTGNAEVSFSLAGPLKVGANGKASTGPVGLRIEYEHLTYLNRHGEEVRYLGVECIYTNKTLKGTNAATTTPHELGVELEGDFALDASQSSENAKRICPRKAEVALSLGSDQSETGVVEEQVVG